MSARKSSHRTIFLIVSSGSPLALIASSLRSTSKKPVCPMTRSFHPPMAIAISESDSQRLGEKNFSRWPIVKSAKRSQFLSTSPTACGNLLAGHLRSRRPTTRSSAPRRRPAPPVRARQPLEADQREMSERRHRAALEQAHAAVTLGPSRHPLPAEFRPPAQPPRDRCKALL